MKNIQKYFLKYIVSFGLVLIAYMPALYAQQKHYQISGQLPEYLGKALFLKGFEAFKDTLLATAVTDQAGRFVLQYPEQYAGAALLELQEGASLIVLLHRENFSFYWRDTRNMEDLLFENSAENEAFLKGIRTNIVAEGKLAGLEYLLPLYKEQGAKYKYLQKEIIIQQKAYKNFLVSLPKDSYARYYLELRKLLDDMSVSSKKAPERRAAYTNDFNTLDFADDRLVHSGLYSSLLEVHFAMLASYDAGAGSNLMIQSTDAILKSLVKKPSLRLDTAKILSAFFEKRSLFPAAEHLALAILSQDVGKSGNKKNNVFEQYRKMAAGSIAPDIVFTPAVRGKNSLYGIDSKYKLVVFGTSECGECRKELPKFKKLYTHYKDRDIAVVWISMDTSKADFEAFSKQLPFYNYCDYKGWEGAATKDYMVTATPTAYLLDHTNRILHKISGFEQLEELLHNL